MTTGNRIGTEKCPVLDELFPQNDVSFHCASLRAVRSDNNIQRSESGM